MIARGKALLWLLSVLLALTLSTGCGRGAEPGGAGGASRESAHGQVAVGMVANEAGLGDTSLNDLTYAGLERAERELGVEIEALSSAEPSAYDGNIGRLANGGYYPVFAVGASMRDELAESAERYPDVDFVGVDMRLDRPCANCLGLAFRENEAGYLAGVLAALSTSARFDDRLNPARVIGFVGASGDASSRRYEAGFRAGAEAADAGVRIVEAWIPEVGEARAVRAVLSLAEERADIVFIAANGRGGSRAIRACGRADVLCIGSDADRYMLEPADRDAVLTSAVKKIDEAVFRGVKDAVEGNFQGGRNMVFGLREDGVGLAPYHGFDGRIPPSIRRAVQRARADVVNGVVEVPEDPESVD